jgi:hypothetical protein
VKSANFKWMRDKDNKYSKGSNTAMRETKKLLMKIAGAK